MEALTPASVPATIIPVRNADELTKALADVSAGQTIELAAGTYVGNFSIVKSGTEKLPIYIKGANAVLSSPVISTGVGLHLDKVNYIVVDGITIVGSQKGLVLDASSHCTLQNLEISGSGMEGVHFRTSSQFNTLKNSQIHDTGLSVAKYGEAVYLGSAYENWARYMGNAETPDDSSDNLIFNNTIGPMVSAEAIDVKEGTVRNLIVCNEIFSQSTTICDSAIDIKGDSSQIIGNTIVNTPTITADRVFNGIQCYAKEDAGIIAYGQGNLFDGNSVNLNSTFGTADFIPLPKSGYAIYIHGKATATVFTNNQFQNGMALSNVATSTSTATVVPSVVYGDDASNNLVATNGSDTLYGRGGNDILISGNGDGFLDGGSGQDTMMGGAGNDTLDGGAGSDIEVVSGMTSAYTFKLLANGDVQSTGPDGVDIMRNIETIRFDGNDTSKSLMSLLPTAHLEAQPYAAKVEAYFFSTIGRAATDAELTQFTTGLSQHQGSVWDAGLVAYLASTTDFATLTAGKSNGTIVDEMYHRLTGTTITQAIHDYYTPKLDAQLMKTRGLANAMLNDLVLMPKADNTLGQPGTWSVKMFDNLTPTDYLGYLQKLELVGVDVVNLDASGNLS